MTAVQPVEETVVPVEDFELDDETIDRLRRLLFLSVGQRKTETATKS